MYKLNNKNMLEYHLKFTNEASAISSSLYISLRIIEIVCIYVGIQSDGSLGFMIGVQPKEIKRFKKITQFE